jgi:hypothetical protein
MTIQELADLVLEQSRERLERLYSAEQASWETVAVRPGPVYTKIDRGPEHNMSGMLMIENATGRIYGIKGYGRVHKGHAYGTLDTVDQWYWGDYYPRRRVQRTTPQQASWYAHAVVGTEDETSEVDAYFDSKPERADLFVPADGWRIIEFTRKEIRR